MEVFYAREAAYIKIFAWEHFFYMSLILFLVFALIAQRRRLYLSQFSSKFFYMPDTSLRPASIWQKPCRCICVGFPVFWASSICLPRNQS